mmetsp:Transcript_43574/g.99849  ORF Transcript_43574/g.99849 Transcript_43574/m.99849 type:complete len:269 (-) Transcript_43574:531-1337(-)
MHIIRMRRLNKQPSHTWLHLGSYLPSSVVGQGFAGSSVQLGVWGPLTPRASVTSVNLSLRFFIAFSPERILIHEDDSDAWPSSERSSPSTLECDARTKLSSASAEDPPFESAHSLVESRVSPFDPLPSFFLFNIVVKDFRVVSGADFTRRNSSTALFAAAISCSRRSLAASIFRISSNSIGFSARMSGSLSIRRNVFAERTTTSTVVFAWIEALRRSAPNRDRSPKKSPRLKRLTTIMRSSSMTMETDPSTTMYIAEEIDPLWQIHSC